MQHVWIVALAISVEWLLAISKQRGAKRELHERD